MGWCDEHRRLGVRANADAPHDAEVARRFGAAGIGLCRTEHMFFGEDRINPMRRMIVAETETSVAPPSPTCCPCSGRTSWASSRRWAPTRSPSACSTRRSTSSCRTTPTRRPRSPNCSTSRWTRCGTASRTCAESNPMLGHRGCRLGITFPEITEMQATAIYEAAVDAAEAGVTCIPEVMVPLVGTVNEFRHQRIIVDRVAAQVAKETGTTVKYLVGTMIELPRAALTARQIAAEAEFFSFGTNDLTQTTLGLSRDDAGRFLPLYVERGIYKDDPFQVLDVEGVGRLIEMATIEGRAARPALKVGICGEHGGEPRSVAFCHGVGLDYVSCSPFRVPIARLAAAQAVKG
jgi:pyruvate,orthophosphate dikinase